MRSGLTAGHLPAKGIINPSLAAGRQHVAAGGDSAAAPQALAGTERLFIDLKLGNIIG